MQTPRLRTRSRPALAAAAFLGLLSLGSHCRTEEPDEAPSRSAPTLEDRLTTGLKARRPEDVAYIGRVAELVRQGRLPEKMVGSTYTWAIRRRQSHPFPSFQRALDLQAGRLGIEIE